MSKIHYAFGRDYLKDWTLSDALREVFQNYIDFGEYKVERSATNCGKFDNIKITNDYNPESLEFLRLGNTTKDNGDFIGHHGEGLKAAFLIFAREGLPFNITTRNYILKGKFDYSEEIGETLYIEYTNHNSVSLDKNKFITSFQCPSKIYDEFINNIIGEDDILYSDDYYGDLLKDHKGKGNIYSGNLFVCNIKDVNNSYNIRPCHLQLDRDRRVPRDFDLFWATGRILDSFNNYNKNNEESISKINNINFNSKEYQYSNTVPEPLIESIKAVSVNGKIQYYDKRTDTMITNHNVKQTLDTHPKFQKERELSKKVKYNNRVHETKRKSPITLLKEFKKDYCGNNENMIIDIDVIINKLKKK